MRSHLGQGGLGSRGCCPARSRAGCLSPRDVGSGPHFSCLGQPAAELGLPPSGIPEAPWPAPASTQTRLLPPHSVRDLFTALCGSVFQFPPPCLPGAVPRTQCCCWRRSPSSGQGRAEMHHRLIWPCPPPFSGCVSTPVGPGFRRNTFPGRAASSASQPHQRNHSPSGQAHSDAH